MRWWIFTAHDKDLHFSKLSKLTPTGNQDQIFLKHPINKLNIQYNKHDYSWQQVLLTQQFQTIIFAEQTSCFNILCKKE